MIVRNEDFGIQSGIQYVAKWVRQSRKRWNNQIQRMEDNRFARCARNNTTAGRRHEKDQESAVNSAGGSSPARGSSPGLSR